MAIRNPCHSEERSSEESTLFYEILHFVQNDKSNCHPELAEGSTQFNVIARSQTVAIRYLNVILRNAVPKNLFNFQEILHLKMVQFFGIKM